MKASLPGDARCRLLLVDDDPDIHELVAEMLASENVDIISAIDGNQAVEVARRKQPDLMLLDYDLPDANGIEVLGRLRADGVTESIPAIFLTDNDSQKVLTACFQAGGADCIRKPFCASELRARVQNSLDRKQLLAQMERLAMHDALTGLANRTSIREQIQAAIDGARRNNHALLFLDFDRFKLVNDSLGHDVGDQLLQQIANRLRSAIRRADGVSYHPKRTSAARLGGDEFVVFLEDLPNPEDALRVAERLLTTLADPYCLAGHQVCCTASIGVVTSLGNYTTPDEVLRDADTAMYEAKAAGKGRYVVFDQAMHARAEARLRIETELHSAIAGGELFLVYQPIVSLESGRTVGCEALLRWRHPQRGVIMPAEFLPVAVDSGLIVPMETWAIDRACREFAVWQQTLGCVAPANIHVKLSRRQLSLRDLSATVRAALTRHGVAPECLHLEFTESEIMQNPQVAKATFRELRQIGVKIDMDDFGTGHSSLACLQEFPIDYLKIDRAFIANMERSRSFAALVHAVTTLGHNLGLTTVAEGIETADQLAMLQSMDCEFGQGYFFARPMTADEVSDYLCPRTRPRDESDNAIALELISR